MTAHHSTDAAAEIDREAHADEIPADLVIMIGIVSSIVLLVIVVGTQAWFYSAYEQTYQERNVEVSNRWLQTVQNEQLEVLNSYGMTNREAGLARVPISEAIDLWVSQNENRSRSETVAP